MDHNLLPFEDFDRLVYSTLRKLNIAGPHDDYRQEAYFIYWNSKEKHNPVLSKFSTYFTYELRHHFLSTVRKEKRDQQVRQGYLHQTLLKTKEDPLDEQTMLFDIHHNYHLTPLEREVFQLTYEGFPVKDIAAMKQISLSTVIRVRNRLKVKIARQLV